MKIVFLDFDGVILSERNGFKKPDKACVAALNKITDGTGAQIIVTSTWREDKERLWAGITRTGWRRGDEQNHAEPLPLLLSRWGVTGNYFGKTPTLDTRQEEIEASIAAHGVTGYAILDDLPLRMRRHVQTDKYTGLTNKDADKAVELLEV